MYEQWLLKCFMNRIGKMSLLMKRSEGAKHGAFSYTQWNPFAGATLSLVLLWRINTPQYALIPK